MKSFKAHMMYDKAGKGRLAKTEHQHLDMKSKGYGHSKPMMGGKAADKMAMSKMDKAKKPSKKAAKKGR